MRQLFALVLLGSLCAPARAEGIFEGEVVRHHSEVVLIPVGDMGISGRMEAVFEPIQLVPMFSSDGSIITHVNRSGRLDFELALSGLEPTGWSYRIDLTDRMDGLFDPVQMFLMFLSIWVPVEGLEGMLRESHFDTQTGEFQARGSIFYSSMSSDSLAAAANLAPWIGNSINVWGLPWEGDPSLILVATGTVAEIVIPEPASAWLMLAGVWLLSRRPSTHVRPSPTSSDVLRSHHCG